LSELPKWIRFDKNLGMYKLVEDDDIISDEEPEDDEEVEEDG
jgi:hypothetical protein